MSFDPHNPFGDGTANPLTQWLTSFMGLSSIFAAVGMLSSAFLGSSIRMLILGSIVETGRRLFQWVTARMRFQYSITAQFNEGDPAYEWIVLFLTQENVWRRSQEFTVTATNSRRKWSVKTWLDPKVEGNAEYVPTYQAPQLFRWKGHWVEIKRSKEGDTRMNPFALHSTVATIYLTIYTLDLKLLSALVEDARARYVEVNRPNVVIHLADSPQYGPALIWTNVKHKVRRPLSSVILQDGVVDALVHDAKEFLATEDWYVEAGIPHRRGYLLYGPPGTGKTSTIYALAGALNLEIYSLSLASNFVDDSFLQRAASSIPRQALFLIEDIDCAFASREDEEEEYLRMLGAGRAGPPDFDSFPSKGKFKGAGGGGEAVRSQVTLSGLLNVIDGVGSEEGKLFFATTNYIDRLDLALLRPGRIDMKVQYELSTRQQAHDLFLRFFPESRFPDFAAASSSPSSTAESSVGKDDKNTESVDSIHASDALEKPGPSQEKPTLFELAATFAAAIPPGEFSTAELQGYLQSHKTSPVGAAKGAAAWLQDIRDERRKREERELARKRRLQVLREGWDAAKTGKGKEMGRDVTAPIPSRIAVDGEMQTHK
ncbi:P-loop containing nucleoside triphosphate hydrolase protein [Favolaschia claudopus]|uniref:P-loop containing nucleoside triphosphate hydrolase protein n=1 Tax=Favolaschia claudopus TaxID=2862362 RepID=A0AAW0DMM7_9AGAR